jgi:hypothetical protein
VSKTQDTELSLKETSLRKSIELDYKAMEKRYSRRHFKDLRDTHALIHCRIDYLQNCWNWLYGDKEVGVSSE